MHPHLSRLSEIDFGLLFRSLSTSWPQNCGLKDFTEFVIQSCSMVAVKDSLKSIGKVTRLDLVHFIRNSSIASGTAGKINIYY